MKFLRLSIISIALSAFIGCSIHSKRVPSTFKDVPLAIAINKHLNKHQKSLLRRASLYWMYRLKNNKRKSFYFELPYQQYLLGYDGYKKIASRYEDVAIKIIDVNVSKNGYGTVTKIERALDNNFTQKIKDKWLFINGKWYHKFYSSLLPHIPK